MGDLDQGNISEIFGGNSLCNQNVRNIQVVDDYRNTHEAHPEEVAIEQHAQTPMGNKLSWIKWLIILEKNRWTIDWLSIGMQNG